MPTKRLKEHPVNDACEFDARPQRGDVVISQERAQRYVLSRVPGRAQIFHANSDALLALARRFAEHARVDCWFTADGACTRLGSHRTTAASAVAASVKHRPTRLKPRGPRRDRPVGQTAPIRPSDRERAVGQGEMS